MLVAALAPPLQAQPGPIADAPVKAFEPGLVTDDHLPGELAWIDRRTLLVTTLATPDGPFYERKVVLVDIERGVQREVVSQGALACANPEEGVAGLWVGSEAALYTGNSKAPKPTLKLYGWEAAGGQLTPRETSVGWNASICRRTQADDIHTVAPGFLQSGVRYLVSRHGRLMLEPGTSGRPSKVALIKPDGKALPVEATADEIAPVPEYLPFTDEYLLSSGRFMTNGRMARGAGTAENESPMITMTPAGKVRREKVLPLFEGHALSVDGETLPIAKGTLILIGSRPQQGGGIYLARGPTLKRVWCLNGGGVYDRRCQVLAAAVSPDGCHLAFHAVGSDSLAVAPSLRPSLKILPLCDI